jgi:hypothetical protein
LLCALRRAFPDTDVDGCGPRSGDKITHTMI